MCLYSLNSRTLVFELYRHLRTLKLQAVPPGQPHSFPILEALRIAHCSPASHWHTKTQHDFQSGYSLIMIFASTVLVGQTKPDKYIVTYSYKKRCESPETKKVCVCKSFVFEEDGRHFSLARGRLSYPLRISGTLLLGWHPALEQQCEKCACLLWRRKSAKLNT